MKKYCSPKKSQGLDLQQIKLFGRQILEVNDVKPTPSSDSHSVYLTSAYFSKHNLRDLLDFYFRS